MSKATLRKSFLIILVIVMVLVNFAGCGGRVEDKRDLDPFENTLFYLAGTDALGRKVSPVDGYRKDGLYVGMWYSFWHGQHPALQPRIRDIQKLLDMGEEGEAILRDKSDVAAFYYWGEPLYGYYDSRDPFVMARHIELFTFAGIDFICVDATNQYDYLEVGTVFLNLLKKYKDQGFKVPGVCFYTNTNSGSMVNRIYRDYYEDGRWDGLWFAPNGKPLIAGITENNMFASDQTRFWGTTDYVSATMQNYFEVKESQWPNGIYNANGLPWMSWKYPQDIHNGYAAVPVAQHDPITTYFSAQAPQSHRGYNNITKKVEGDYREGLSFQQMWDSVLERKDEISTVFVCCWNEWIAQKQSNGAFIDVYNWAYSRDVEMMKGGYGDNYYMQLVKNVREFKYSQPVQYIWPVKTIDINGSLSQWDGIKAHYKDFAEDAIVRDFKMAAGTEKYTDSSARNDITDIKVVHDENNLYFYIQTLNDITQYNGTDENWMNILIKTGQENDKSFEGYQYLVNKHPSGSTTSVEKSQGGYNWEAAGEAKLAINKNVMLVSIPLKSLDLSKDNCSIEFKVADNVTNYMDIMDYYVTGDSAPIGRLNYSYGYEV